MAASFNEFSIEIRVPCRAGITKLWLRNSTAQLSAQCWCQEFILTVKKFQLPFALFNAFKAIGSPRKSFIQNTTKYVTCECYFIFIFLYFTFSFLTLLTLRLLAKRIDFFPPCWFSLNNSEMVKAVTLAFCRIQKHPCQIWYP